MENVIKFEDEYPEESKILINICSLPPKFNCPRGHKHYFNFLNYKINGEIVVTPLRYCNG
jgi:hypothetical protein